MEFGIPGIVLCSSFDSCGDFVSQGAGPMFFSLKHILAEGNRACSSVYPLSHHSGPKGLLKYPGVNRGVPEFFPGSGWGTLTEGWAGEQIIPAGGTFLRWFVKLQIEYCWDHLPKSDGDQLLTRFSLPGEEAGKSLLPEAFILTLEKSVSSAAAPTELFSGPKQRLLRQLFTLESTPRISIATWVPAGRPRNWAESCRPGLRKRSEQFTKRKCCFIEGFFAFCFFLKIEFWGIKKCV